MLFPRKYFGTQHHISNKMRRSNGKSNIQYLAPRTHVSLAHMYAHVHTCMYNSEVNTERERNAGFAFLFCLEINDWDTVVRYSIFNTALARLIHHDDSHHIEIARALLGIELKVKFIWSGTTLPHSPHSSMLIRFDTTNMA